MKTLFLFLLIPAAAFGQLSVTIPIYTDAPGVPAQAFANTFVVRSFPGGPTVMGSFSWPNGATSVTLPLGNVYTVYSTINLTGEEFPYDWSVVRHCTPPQFAGDEWHQPSFYYMPPWWRPNGATNLNLSSPSRLVLLRGKNADGSTGVFFLHAKKKL